MSEITGGFLTDNRYRSPEELERERLIRVNDPSWKTQERDMSLVISDRGNALKADLDDITNPQVIDVGIQKTPVAGDIGSQTATNDPISNLIGNIMGIFKGVIDTIGGIL